MTSLVNMTSFNLYPLASRCKHSRCHVRKFIHVIEQERGRQLDDSISGTDSRVLTLRTQHCIHHFSTPHDDSFRSHPLERRTARQIPAGNRALGHRPRAGRAIVSTNFRPYEAAILHLAVQAQPDIPVLWVDHGYNRPATYKHAEELADAAQAEPQAVPAADHGGASRRDPRADPDDRGRGGPEEVQRA